MHPQPLLPDARPPSPPSRTDRNPVSLPLSPSTTFYLNPLKTSPGHAGPIPTPEEVEQYMEPYKDMCDQWVRDQKEARVLGKRRTPGSGATGGGEGSGEEGKDGTGSLDDGAGANNGDYDDECPTKHRIVFHNGKLPWVKNEPLAAAPLRTDLAKTVRLLDIYGFPESQWLRLLTNRALDLDTVFSSLYSLILSTAHTETMRAVEAGLVIFPHLSEQYRVWGIFIMGKFATVHESQHLRVIEFEKACRLLASRRADVSLNQLHHFTALETMHLSSMGCLAIEAGGNTSSREKSQSSNNCGGGKNNGKTKPYPAKSGEPFWLWNTGCCKRKAEECRNLHICAACSKNHHESECANPTALGTETDPPFPGVPPEAFRNRELVNTVVSHPSLFRISMPIKVDLFEQLLASHPNQPLVKSFCKGMREGFWPWSRPDATHPHTFDGLKDVCSDAERLFLEKTRDEELEAGRFSKAFPVLLPGMHAIPIHAVPKPHSEKLRLVTDFSGGEFSRNSTISRLETNQTHMDGIRELADHLRALRRSRVPDAEINIFKSDVKGAFNVLPMHLLCQPWQFGIAGKFQVDRAATFGSSASPPIWTTFAGLVLWIAMAVYAIAHLFAYMDDFHSVQAASQMQFYKPYKHWFPQNQTRLLLLRDKLGIPHSEDKQVFGPELVVIGFLVDSRRMRVTVPDDACLALVAELRRWTRKSKHGVQCSLHDWQALAGYINWVFNVFPLLKPSLCNVYAKMEEKDKPHALISNTVSIFDLLKALPTYNDVLISLVDVLLAHDIGLHVLHVPGKLNKVADALSRWKDKLAARLAIALGYVIDKSTNLMYTSALNSYINFCTLHTFPLEPTNDTMSFFVIYMCHHIAPKLVDSYLSGICNQLESAFPDVRKVRASPLVKNTLNGARFLFGKGTKRKRPLSTTDLRTVEHAVQAQTTISHDDKLFVGMLFSGFDGLLRLGELSWPDIVALRNWKKVIRRSSVKLTDSSFGFFLPGHKADKFFEGNQIIITSRADPELNTPAKFRRYLTRAIYSSPTTRRFGYARTGPSPPAPGLSLASAPTSARTSRANQCALAAPPPLQRLESPRIRSKLSGAGHRTLFQIYIRKNPTVLQSMLFGRSAHDGPIHDTQLAFPVPS
ncbi:hypothetical protein B0H14DRAFT_3477459 [Mycena olivaceomarginata]|nr:hypothetical protein B0H14DRAFT_3477459 [Mycena olivaceomarginata]